MTSQTMSNPRITERATPARKALRSGVVTAAVLLGLAAGSTADAASLSFTLDTVANAPISRDPNSTSDFQQEASPGVALTGPTTGSSASAATGGSSAGQGTATAGFNIDPSAGVLKFGTSASVTPSSAPIDTRATGFLELGLFETFSITGTGDFTFTMDIDGLLSATQNVSATSQAARVSARILLSDPSASRFSGPVASDRFNTKVNEGQSAVIDQVLSITASIDAATPKDFGLAVFIQSQSSVSEKANGTPQTAQSDFFSTAFLSFSTTGSLTATPSSATFLSGTTAAVPLPAGMWLMLAGLGGLGALGAGRRGRGATGL